MAYGSLMQNIAGSIKSTTNPGARVLPGFFTAQHTSSIEYGISAFAAAAHTFKYPFA
jgi:hypothetical protein